MALFETIPYQVIRRDGKIEIRQYHDFLLASTKTSMNSTMDSGFNNVFDYIAGGNSEQKKISMTTPVVTYVDDQALVTGFYVPKKFSNSTAPKPNSGNVFINEMNQAYYAVMRFRGSWRKSNLDKFDALLKKYLVDKGIRWMGNQLFFRYQPPIVPGLFRRNEILYRIDSIE